MTTRPIVFADLDDSLFQTKRKIAPGKRDGLVVAATAADGDPAKTSYMTARQAALVAWLRETTDVVPVTARSAASFGRVRLGFDGWSVISNGAVILRPGGAVHADWARRMHRVLSPLHPALDRLLEAGRASATERGLDMRSWIVEDDGLATYVVFKLNDPTCSDALTTLDLSGAGVDLTGWVRHTNANNLSLIPPGSGKAPAVRHLLGLLDPDRTRPVLGIADSLSDLDFLRLSDFCAVPMSSQIAVERLGAMSAP